MDLDKLQTTAGRFKAERVIVRADLNVPVKDGKVTDATRLERPPGLQDLAGGPASSSSRISAGPRAARPAVQLKPVADKLGELLAHPVVRRRLPRRVGGRTVAAPSGQIAAENLRFRKGEEKNDPEFAKALAKLGDIFINDAFSPRTRACSTRPSRLLPAYAGPLLMEEVDALVRVWKARRSTAPIGGAKVSSKIDVLTIQAKVDRLIIGGAMANTFFRGGRGDANRWPSHPSTPRSIMHAASAPLRGHPPHDVVVAAELERALARGPRPRDAGRSDDPRRGPQDDAHYAGVIGRCKTLLWNGPLGAFEVAPFGEGTFALAREGAALTKAGKLTSVAGGGDTVAALNAAGVTGDFTYVSTAGGAFLEWLEGRILPGIAALARARS
jgi:phosphoglycerate kinase